MTGSKNDVMDARAIRMAVQQQAKAVAVKTGGLQVRLRDVPDELLPYRLRRTEIRPASCR